MQVEWGFKRAQVRERAQGVEIGSKREREKAKGEKREGKREGGIRRQTGNGHPLE